MGLTSPLCSRAAGTCHRPHAFSLNPLRSHRCARVASRRPQLGAALPLGTPAPVWTQRWLSSLGKGGYWSVGGAGVAAKHPGRAPTAKKPHPERSAPR